MWKYISWGSIREIGKVMGGAGSIIAIRTPAEEEADPIEFNRREMSKKNNLARRKKQHEFDLKSNSTLFHVRFLRDF